MKDPIIEYYPNGNIKHEIEYYDSIGYEYFYNEEGKLHREDNLPVFQEWYENGMLKRKAYARHGLYHNICNPAAVYFKPNGKIECALYKMPKCWIGDKLSWTNYIKNI